MRDDIVSLIDDRPDSGVFRVHRRAFEDPEIFELEMRYLFESGWVFLGLANQAPNPHDFFTTWIGRTPVLVSRDGGGKLACFINSCRHKRATVCHAERGNARTHVCRYHGWVYDSAGANKMVRQKECGGYPTSFDADNHDLLRIPLFESYRGVLFGSLNPGAGLLEQHIGEVLPILDLILDQSPQGIELIPGTVTFTYDANWKFQLENCGDGYHFVSTHPSYLHLVAKRAESANRDLVKTTWSGGKRPEPGALRMGSFGFRNGHSLLWSTNFNADSRPLYERESELRQRLGDVRTDWLFRTRNFTIFPNVQFAENASSQLRIIRPLSVEKTEMRTYCFAPVGESRSARAERIRQYGDFFNPSGLATPDDTATYEDCQLGYRAQGDPWQQGYMRGSTASVVGPNASARLLGLSPATSAEGPLELYDETLFHSLFRAWQARLLEGLANDNRSRTAAAA